MFDTGIELEKINIWHNTCCKNIDFEKTIFLKKLIFKKIIHNKFCFISHLTEATTI